MQKKLLMYLLWHSLHYKYEDSLEATERYFLRINNGPSPLFGDAFWQGLRYDTVVNYGDRYSIAYVNEYAGQNGFLEDTPDTTE